MIRLGMAGEVLMGGAEDVAQADKMKERNRKDINRCISILFNRLLKLFERGHPGDRVDEICKRIALLTKGADSRANRVLACRAARDIRVGSMKGEVGLVQFTQQVSIFPEELPAFLHVGFGSIYFIFQEHLIDCDARLVHFGAEVKRWRVLELA